MMPMSTELEILTSNLHAGARSSSESLAALPSHVAAITQYALTPEQAHKLDELVQELLLWTRSMQFDAARLKVLIDKQTQSDRKLFSTTMQAVDVCRFARATPDVEKPQDARTLALADAVEQHMADMQDMLRERFDGEDCPGD